MGIILSPALENKVVISPRRLRTAGSYCMQSFDVLCRRVLRRLKRAGRKCNCSREVVHTVLGLDPSYLQPSINPGQINLRSLGFWGNMMLIGCHRRPTVVLLSNSYTYTQWFE